MSSTRTWISLLGFGLLTAVTTAAADDLRISGPFTHENLSVYLVHSQINGAGKAGMKSKLMPLQEAMAAKKVVVYETGNVSQLSIENLSGEDVYVQSGDIVKGGQQDRVLTTDLVLPAHSGKLPIASFCVEQGRWTKRGAEPAEHFASSSAVVPSKELKMAVREKGAQGDVWNYVAASRAKLAPATVSGTGNGGGVGTGQVSMARMPMSEPGSTSMQLALEKKEVVDATEGYRKALAKIVEGKSDVVGFVYAINGQINSAELYGSSDLFARMWPKLLRASATEAYAERTKAKATVAPSVDQVKSSLAEAERGSEKSKDAAGRASVTKKESSKVLLFETRDQEAWIHRSYVVK